MLRVAFVVCLTLLFHGCAFYKLESELASASNLFVITGLVRSESATTGVLVVSAYQTDSGQTTPTGYDVLESSGRFVITLPGGKHHLAAFQDINGNMHWDQGEPATYYGEVEPSGLKLKLHDDFDLTVAAGPSLAKDFPSNPFQVARHPVQLAHFGTSVSLDMPTFAARYGHMGLWQPYTFIYEAAPGLYMLEPYDSSRIPVLFVHGAGGTPQDWRYFIDRLDRTQYQAWVYHYASGLPLELNAFYLNRFTDELHRMHGFGCVFVAAHSVGGLVAKRFIDMSQAGTRPTYVGLFISIAAPWGGIESAQSGVKHSPVAIPSWVDISPESKFLSALYAQSAPQPVPHVLLFAYRRDRELRPTDSDGRVTLKSQLDARITNSAFEVDGVNAEHSEILHSEAAFETFSKVIDVASGPASANAQCTLRSADQDGNS